jgi:hypothetical protein
MKIWDSDGGEKAVYHCGKIQVFIERGNVV